MLTLYELEKEGKNKHDIFKFKYLTTLTIIIWQWCWDDRKSVAVAGGSCTCAIRVKHSFLLYRHKNKKNTFIYSFLNNKRPNVIVDYPVYVDKLTLNTRRLIKVMPLLWNARLRDAERNKKKNKLKR